MQAKMVRVSRFMKKKYTNEKQFNKALKAVAPADANGNISVDALKNFVL